ncbi:hypothetical protein I5Q19_20150 [Pseudomonas stutzeri]|uniref:hypothetical protein n=1 Tax=Stutzerimonas stutzeri TaxID=316 RepID=UPI0018D8CEA9|nr:hypothetical protein [Stutzerimonas stutzeri]MBH3356079.1 hypothetical protein [Stutzerimonas stutzeri]
MEGYVQLDHNIAKFLDTSALNTLIRTEDEIGCALRAQLLFEQFLSVYLDERIAPAQKHLFNGLRYFDQRLMVAVAFGLPVELADPLKAANQIRNDFGHEPNATFRPDKVKRFTTLVNAAPNHLFELSTVEESKFFVGDEKNVICYGLADCKTDFGCAAVILLQKCANWLISDLNMRGALRTKPANPPVID